MDSEQYIITAYAGGFPVGYQDHKASYLFNHVNIIVEYHPLDDGSRVVGFYVEPFTVKHKFANDAKWDGSGEAPPLSTCDKSGPMVYEAIAAKQDVQTGPVIFTYDVLWRASNVKWASRWDIYLSMDNAVPDKVHWFSIVNSLLIVLFLTVMVAMIMVRNLHRDIVRYNRVLSDEEKAEDREECDAASRGLSEIIRHRCEAVSGLFFEFERISGEVATRYISRAGPAGSSCMPMFSDRPTSCPCSSASASVLGSKSYCAPRSPSSSRRPDFCPQRTEVH